ncbi:MAG: OmpA family protein [Myxococcales bacterium]|nr:OmpA family protein [Myxococcales bacterium]
MRWLALLLPLLLASPAGAQGNARRFYPSPALSPYLTLDGSHTQGDGSAAASLLLGYERRPLIFYKNGRRTADIVAYRAAADVTGVFGLTPWIDVGLTLPLVLSQDGRTVQTGGDLESFALGDPGLALKLELLDKLEVGVGLALVAHATLPFGDATALTGEENATLAGRVALEVPWGDRFDLAVNAGYRAREATPLDDVVLDDELLLGLGASLRVTPAFALVAELNAATPVDDLFGSTETSPADVNGGVRLHLWRGLQLVAGAGAGLNPGYGSPTFRLFAGVEAAPRRHDFDGDRVADGWDDCLEVPGAPDHGGCPAPVAQKKPPKVPVADADGDRVPDDLDQCPRLPEDRDTFRDDDGCPDGDNDLDLIADAYDADPVGAEDWDDFEDADGVPDLDNDRDGVADFRDGCPNEPGGRDGCPGSPPLDPATLADGPGFERPGGPDAPWLLGQTIHPARPILFQFAKPELTPEMAPVIAGLAAFLAENPTVGPVEVGVHVDAMGSRRWKHWLSNRRAYTIVQALVAYGVDPRRLVPRGYGPEMPVATNDTKEGRAKNRRVELRVLSPVEQAGPKRAGGRRAAPLPPPRDTWDTPGAVILRPDRPIVFVVRNHRLTPEAAPLVDALAERLKANPAWRRVEVGVHTDGLGDLRWKAKLSLERARAVKAALVERGVEAERLVPRGYGATRRLRPDDTKADRAINRRVELTVLENGGLSTLAPRRPR